MARPGKGTCLKAATLQWGRGCEPTDGLKVYYHRGEDGIGFNGAAGVNPRMVSEMFAGADFAIEASMGPRV